VLIAPDRFQRRSSSAWLNLRFGSDATTICEESNDRQQMVLDPAHQQSLLGA